MMNKGCCAPNVGKVDRMARAVFGLVLIALVFVGPQTPWGWLGLIPLASAAMGWCGLYTLCRINTCGKGDCCKTDGADTTAPKDGCCGGHCHSEQKAG
jgi:hypothetical protein